MWLALLLCCFRFGLAASTLPGVLPVLRFHALPAFIPYGFPYIAALALLVGDDLQAVVVFAYNLHKAR